MRTLSVISQSTVLVLGTLLATNSLHALETIEAPQATILTTFDYSKLALGDWTQSADEVIKTLDAERDGGGIDALNKFKIALDPKKNGTMEQGDLQVALETLKTGHAKLHARLLARASGK